MQSTLRQRVIVLLAVFGAGILFLLPTFFKGSFTTKWISRPISLGLDLSGGVHLVYQVVTKEAVKSRLQGSLQRLRADLRQEKIPVTKGVVNDNNQIEITLFSERTLTKVKDKVLQDYKNLLFASEERLGEKALLRYGVSDTEVRKIEVESVRQAVETLRNRVDQFGVAEPLIQQVGSDRIMLQMPGVSDIEGVKKVVGSVAKLEFRLVPLAGTKDNAVKLKDRSGLLVEVEDQSLMTGDAVEDARVSHRDAQVEVGLTLTSEGGRTFYKITKENVERQLAIVLDNVVYSTPVIREPISGGQASISGSFTFEEASLLALVLRAGALPAPLDVLEERTVGPTLGGESIQKAIVAIVVGFAFITIFMMVYYGKSGVVAVASLIFNLFLLLAALSAFGATLTLPGLAGLALTAGMAVDSNVIIFERIRDELRIGAGRDAAVLAGFDKALSAIIDSNLTTLLSAMVLYFFGTGPIRGFAVTLSIGIMTTIFCATYAARVAFDYFPLKGRKELSI